MGGTNPILYNEPKLRTNLEISKIKQQIPKTKRLALEFGIYKVATCLQLELLKLIKKTGFHRIPETE